MSSRAWRRRLFGLALGTLSLGAAPRPAQAWDPGATHQGITDRAVRQSALHRRWMDATELQRGVFSPLRIEPGWLSPEQIRVIEGARKTAPADNGAVPLGGPGACPGADAPPETQRYCVRGDTWEATALAWLRLGMIAETQPSARLAHHFLDRENPAADTWKDPELPAIMLRRRQVRGNGEALASSWTGTGFGGRNPSAAAWLERPADADPLAPAALHAHLERASMAETRKEREHHLAMALLATGALLHVLQDASVPAHARGDASAFAMPLSAQTGDRGLPLQEYARVSFGRYGLPGRADEAAPDGIPLTPSLRAHLLGDEHYEGIGRIAGDRFWSESSIPAPVAISPELTPTEAARRLIGDTRLDPVEREGAYLDPWPADTGYLRTKTGRVLSAWAYDGRGRIEPYLDEAVFRQQVVALVPEAVEVSRSILDLLWPRWPGPVRLNGPVLELEVPDDLERAEVIVLAQRESGDRQQLQRIAVKPGASNRIVGLPSFDEPGARVVVVILGKRRSGDPYVVEQTLSPTSAPRPAGSTNASNPTAPGPEDTAAGVAGPPSPALDGADSEDPKAPTKADVEDAADDDGADEDTAGDDGADEETADEETADEETADEKTADDDTADDDTADDDTADDDAGAAGD